MKEKKFSDFEIEEKTSGGAVFEQGVKQSKEHKAIRRMINRKPTSYQAVSWIKRELQKRKR